MGRLGISIYPDKEDKNRILEYIEEAHKAGFSRIFSCLLSVEDTKEKIRETFLEINQFAKARGFEVIVDVSPKVFADLEISYNELSFFNEIGADGLRLDMGFTGNEESLMTFNPYDLKIEINMSNDTSYVDTIMDYQPNKRNLIACHNFYPHAHCGLDFDLYMSTTKRFSKYGLRTAAFVTSQVEGSFGPWPTTEGLPTLEMHRYLPMDVQFKHFIALGNVDDIIISNCYPSTEELNTIARMNRDMVSFDVIVNELTPEIEQKILFEELHFNRGDINPNTIRSTQSRVKYKGHDFKVFNTPEMIRRGDIVIESSLYGHYAGEVQIAKHDMKNNGMSNVVGRIREEEVFILDYIKPWQKFRFNKI